MYVLGIDTSTRTCAVAITDEGTTLGEFMIHDRRTHSEKLMPLVDQLLTSLQMSGAALSGIAAAKGPGAFTGLRIAFGTAQGLARGYNIPLLGVSTLDVLAYQRASHGFVCPVMDARRGETYTALYQVSDGELHKLWSEAVLAPAALAKQLAEILSAGSPLTLVGDAAHKYRAEILEHLSSKQFRINFALPEHDLNRAAVVARLGIERLRTSGTELAPYEVSPTYLRKPEAERKREKEA